MAGALSRSAGKRLPVASTGLVWRSLNWKNPEKCLLRGDSWIFGPEADYERHGDVNDVVFPCGYTMDPDGDTVNIYYGAADCSIAWPEQAYAHYSIGSTLTESVSTGSERMIYNTTVKNRAGLSVCCKFEFSSSAFRIANPEAVLSNTHQTRALLLKHDICAARAFKKSLE